MLVPFAGLLALTLLAGVAHAASVYRCVDARGAVAYQDAACPARAHQTRVVVHPQPRIGSPGEHTAIYAVRQMPRRARPTHVRHHTRHHKPPMSWVCRAADGEVFYRHTHCPSSVRGDGVVRVDYAARMTRDHPRGRRDAWSRIRVHGTRIPRAEACRAIRSPAAAGRDGHLRDAHVSTYARLTGHDPCSVG